MDRTLNKLQHGYITCALWSSSDNSRDDGGDPLDKNYDVDDIADEALAKMKADCDAFLERQLDRLQIFASVGALREYSVEQAGHDFWLSRNGHGAGFFDRNLGELGDRLQDAAEAFGECNLYVGDDGKLYV